MRSAVFWLQEGSDVHMADLCCLNLGSDSEGGEPSMQQGFTTVLKMQ